MIKVNELIFFTNEFDMLEAHINTHAPFIEKTFIVESEVTVSGIPKPLFFKENKERFSQYNLEYIEVPANLQPRAPDWKVFRIQDHAKNQYAHPIAAENCDYVMHSDCDEILYPDSHKKGLETLSWHPGWRFACYKLRQSKTFVNCIQKKVNVYRYVRADKDGYLLSPKGNPRGGTVTGPAGWHFHNCFSTFDEFYWKVLNREWFFGTVPTEAECRYVYGYRGRGMSKITEKEIPEIAGFYALMYDKPELMEPRKQPITYLPKWMQDNIERFPYYV